MTIPNEVSAVLLRMRMWATRRSPEHAAMVEFADELESALTKAEAALREALGAGDTCARSCEAQAVRVEALQLKRRVTELEAAGRADAVPELDYVPGLLDQTCPPKIWLQIDTMGDNAVRSEAVPESCWGDLTWCYESIGGQEVVYIRADLVPPAHSPDAGNMVDVLRIPRPASLDPIIVYFEDSAPGKGRITIACYGDAWTGAWGAMGNRTVRQFVAGVDPDYLAGSLLELRKASDHFRKYTARVAAAVIAALAPQSKDAT